MRTLSLVLAALAFTACKNAEEPVDCSTRAIDVPSARGEVAGVWDEARGRVVFFGGDEGTPVNCQAQTSFVGQTWAFHTDCDNFTELMPATAPPARGRHVAALDSARERMIVHGGRFRDGTSGAYTLRGDTWAFDLATDTWSELTTGGPDARTNHVGVVSGDRFVIYGGNTSTNGAAFTPLGDVWALDLGSNDWSEQTTSGGDPGARLFHAAAVSDDGQTMYVYGGGDENAFFGPFFGDLWALDLQSFTWTELHDGTGAAPAARIWPNLVVDGQGDRLLMWAGHDDGALGNTNQLWAYDLSGGTWSELEQGDVIDGSANGFCDFPADFVAPDLDAPERRNAGVAALTGDRQLVIFGGKSDCGILNDAWTYDLEQSTWSERSMASTGEICQRAFQECDTLCF